MCMDPYRTTQRACPSCNAQLRVFRTRLVCDACEGMFAPIADLAHALEDITGVPPTFEFVDERPGKRACPECAHAMTTFHLRIHLERELAKPKPELDRCADHGVWFDTDELVEVFEKARAKHPGGAGAHAHALSSGGGGDPEGWSGSQKGPFWWGGGHGNY